MGQVRSYEYNLSGLFGEDGALGVHACICGVRHREIHL